MLYNKELDALIAEGRQTGNLSLEQLAARLPVEQMDMLALARIIEHLEAEGIEVDIDPDLSRPRRDAPPPPPVADLLPDTAPPPPRPPERLSDAAEDGPAPQGYSTAPPTQDRTDGSVRTGSSRTWLLWLAAAILLVLLAAIFWTGDAAAMPYWLVR